MTRKLHLVTGMILLVFIASHLTVHLFALAGPQAHGTALRWVQWVYRHPVIEPLLVFAIGLQIILGLRLVVRRWHDPGKDFWGRAQIASGIYLVIFMINHTSAALLTRYGAGLETDFWWVSGPLHHPVMKPFFYPYYALAVIAIAAHLGAALHFRQARKWPPRLSLAAGGIVATCYLFSFGGWLYPVEIKAEYRAYYDALLAFQWPVRD